MTWPILVQAQGWIPLPSSSNKVSRGSGAGANNTLLEGYENFRRESFLCDAELVSNDGVSFKVHTVLVAAFSPRLEDLVGSTHPSHTRSVRFKEPFMRASVLGKVVQWMYRAKVELQDFREALEVLAAARLLRISALPDLCLGAIKSSGLDVDSAMIHWVSLAEDGRNGQLSGLVEDVADFCRKSVCRSFGEIASGSVAHALLMDLSEIQLRVLLEDDELQADQEDNVWAFVRKWVERDVEKRSAALPDLLLEAAVVRLSQCVQRQTLLEISDLLDKSSGNPEASAAAILPGRCPEPALISRGPVPLHPRLSIPRVPRHLVLVMVSEVSGHGHPEAAAPSPDRSLLFAYDINSDRWKQLDLELPPDAHSMSPTCMKGGKEVALVTRTKKYPHCIKVFGLDLSQAGKGQSRELSTFNAERIRNFTPQLVVHADRLIACMSVDSLEIYDPVCNQWHRKNLAVEAGDEGLLSPTFATAGGKLLCVGGCGGANPEDTAARVRCFNEDRNVFERVATLRRPPNRGRCNCCEWNGKLLIFGGASGWDDDPDDHDDDSFKVEQFDPSTNRVSAFGGPLRETNPADMLLSGSRRDFDCHLVQVHKGLLAVEGDSHAFRTRQIRVMYFDQTQEGQRWTSRSPLNLSTDIRVRGVAVLEAGNLDGNLGFFLADDRAAEAAATLNLKAAEQESDKDGVFDLSGLFESGQGTFSVT